MGEMGPGEVTRCRCQIQSLEGLSEPVGFGETIWQGRNRLRRILKRRWVYVQNMFSEGMRKKEAGATALVTASSGTNLERGDIVRVRSKEEIQATLNRWNQLKGCAFMEEMWQFCGTKQRVFKRVEKFLDERDYLMKKCKGIVILDGVLCEGAKDFGDCDRSCFYFWREEWLEKIHV